MPIYEYRCEAHGKFSGWAFMSERETPQECPDCGAPSRYTISAPRVFSDHSGYISPSTGEWVEGRRARLNDLAKSGCRPYEVGEMQDAQRRARDAEAEIDKQIDETVEKTIVELKNG